MHTLKQWIGCEPPFRQRSMVTSVPLGAHPTSDASPMDLNTAFAPVDWPLDAVFSVFLCPESLNPGVSFLIERIGVAGVGRSEDWVPGVKLQDHAFGCAAK
jgi:hypothetical protein